MAEKIEIASLEIDVNDFIKSATQAKKELEELRKSNRELRKSGEQGSQQFVENDIRIKELSKTYRQQTSAAQALNNATKDLAEATNFEAKSVQEVTNQRANFEKLAKQIKGNTDAEIEQRNKLNGIIDKQTEFIRANSSSYGAGKDSIGEYRDAINSSILGNTAFGKVLKTTLDGLQEAKKFTQQATQATKAQVKADVNLTSSQGIARNAIITTNGALKLFRLALISTGIGAIVVALGSLIAFLTTTQEGIDAVTRVTKPFTEVLKEALGIIQDIGKDLFDAFKNPRKFITDVGNLIKSQLIDRFSALGKIVTGIFTLNNDLIKEGRAEIKKSNKALSEALGIEEKRARLANAFDRGKQIADLQIEIEELESVLRLEQSRLKIQIEAERERRKDRRLTAQEREEAAQREIELTETLSGLETEILDKKIAKAKLEAEANDTSRNDQKEINDLIAQREEIEARNIKDRTRIFQAIRGEEKKAEAERLKAVADQNKALIDQQKKELELFEIRNKNALTELELAEEIATRRLEILQDEFDKGLVSELEFQIERLKIQQDFSALQADIALENAELELEAQQQRIEQEIVNEQEKNRRLAELDRQRFEERLQAGKINEQEYNLAINEINDAERERQLELEQERNEIDLANRIETERENLRQIFENRNEELELQRQRELDIAERTGADVNLINEKFDQLQLDLKKDLQAQELAIVADTLGSIATLLGEQTKAGKAFALANALFNTFEGITSALRLPFPASLGAVAQTSATGFKAVSDIRSTNIPKAERGMRIGGRPHSQGGTLIEAERGEAIVTAKAMNSPLGGLVSAINQSFGGVPLAREGMRVGMGATGNLQNALIDYDRLGETFGNALSKMPAPKVAVTEINEVGSNYAQVVERANI